jgi:predicted transposase/invertase (TIGR01784 family)
MNTNSHKVFSDILEMHTLELPKVSDEVREGKERALAEWLRFLRAKNREEVAMAEKARPIIGEAVGRYRQLSVDERMQWLEKQRVEEEWLQQDMLQTAINKGRNAGKSEAAMDIARNLKHLGLAVEQIVKATGLSRAVIENL